MAGHSNEFPWRPYYGHFRFFEQRMNSHSHVIALKVCGDGVYELTNIYSKTLRVFICECYSFGSAEYVETKDTLGGLDAIVINSAWCGYTTEAKRQARRDKVGLFNVGEFMSALNKANIWEYLNPAQYELFQKNGWL